MKKKDSVRLSKGRTWSKIPQQWQLHLLVLLPVIYILIFHYWPMYGAQIAFRDYRAKLGIVSSERADEVF